MSHSHSSPKLALVLALLIAGCGSSSGSATTISSGSTTSGSTSGTGNQSWPMSLEPISFNSFQQGPGSLYMPASPEQILFSDIGSFSAFWVKHSTTRPRFVDFRKQSAIAAFLGKIGGSHHKVDIVQVSREPGGKDFYAVVREFRYGHWKPNTKQLGSPFHIVEVDTPALGSMLVKREQVLDFEVISAGSQSAIGKGDPSFKGSLEVFRDAPSFTTFYDRHAPGHQPPSVDFAKGEMAIAVLAGYRSNYGNSVQTRRILHDPIADELRLEVRHGSYRGGAAPPPATETPFQILRVTAATGSIRLEKFTPQQTRSLDQNQYCNYASSSPETLVIRDQASLDALWNQRLRGNAPSIDFSKEQVIATFMGQRSTGGFSVNIRRLRTDEDGLLQILVNTMMAGPVAPSVLSSPYHVVAAPRSEGPHETETVDITPRP